MIIDTCLKEGYRYEIERAVLSRDAVLHTEMRANFVLPYNMLPELKDELREKIDGVASVQVVFHYSDMVQDENEIVDEFMPYLKVLISRAGGAMAQTLTGDYELSDGVLSIFVVGETAERQLNEHLSGKFSKILSDSFGIGTVVRFENSRERSEAAQADIDECSNEETEEKPKAVKMTSAKIGKRFFGRPIKGEPEKIKDIEPGRKVVCEGDIFNISSRELKNGKILGEIEFYDGTGSMGAKFFTTAEKWDDMSKELEKQKTVKVSGEFDIDKFTQQPVINAKSIERAEKNERSDDSESKRVELHCHTKMSMMDGFNDVTELVDTAARWGHKAIAITDHGVVQALPEAYDAAKGRLKVILGVEGYLFDDRGMKLPDGTVDYKNKSRKVRHVIILAKNREGLKALYEIVSDAHLKYFYKKPRIMRSQLENMRGGLIIGSACVAGEVYSALLEGRTDEELLNIIDFYDYIEIQPLCNNEFLLNDEEKNLTWEDLRNNNRRLVRLAEMAGKPVCATTDAHYGSPDDAVFRKIVTTGIGFSDPENDGLYFRTTEEMLDEFSYLGEETAKKAVIDDPNMIADMIDNISPVPEGRFPPEIDNSDQILRDACETEAKARYGDPLPEEIRARLDRELDSIIGNGYSVMYVSAKMLVEKSLEDGYLVGSRGSVGSSFAATMSGITEVNPLKPHYICPKCKHLIWGDPEKYQTGIDMPGMDCPVCGTAMDRDGYNIPFETFLGFNGTKEPDIDLNFAGEYQAFAHKYVGEIFGHENVFKAGTVGTLKDKSAYGFVMKYFEERGIPAGKYEVDRLTKGCTAVKRTTGQHPGGIVILPRGHSIYEFCPVQRPADDVDSDIKTTHFDYHKIDSNLLKLDILGHDVPSMIRHLQDMTGQDPIKVPLDDADTLRIFDGIEGLGIKDSDYRFKHGTYGIPEFGTPFVRQMLDDIHPKTMGELIRISGFSHGTNVWRSNAQDFIRQGIATMDNAISTRDDIMNYLISKGLPDVDAFNIMEKVRKGKGVTEEYAKLMLDNGVPQWYLDSCRKISYMFPRAHAVAYVMMSFRIAYYKVHYPEQFYAVYFTAKIADFDWELISGGKRAVLKRIDEISAQGSAASAKAQNELIVDEVVYEMFARGYEFAPPSLGYADADRFSVKDGKIAVPLCGISGIGASAGKQIIEAQNERPFATVEDLQTRSGANRSVIETMRGLGLLDGLPESDQLSFF